MHKSRNKDHSLIKLISFKIVMNNEKSNDVTATSIGNARVKLKRIKQR